MIGWRARIGVIIPSGNSVLEPDYGEILPQGVTAHFTRIFNNEDTLEQIGALIHQTSAAAQLLAHVEPDVIAFGCTSGSFLEGPEYDERVLNEIERETGVRGTTTSGAAVEALRLLGVKKLSIFSPYPRNIHERADIFFSACGFEITGGRSLGIVHAGEMVRVGPEQVYQLVRRNLPAGTDGVFLSCTNFRALQAIADLEWDLGLPVVSSNQATIWKSLRLSGVRDTVRRYGQLFERF